jgi:signal transduction histidine kinase
VDRKGVVLFNTADEQLTGKPYERSEIFGKIFNVNKGTLTDTDRQGVKRFYSHATVETTGWKVLVEAPANEVYAEANRGAVRHLVFFLLICLSGGIAALFFSRQLVGKVEQIINGLNEVAAGNFAFRLNIRGNDELAQASSAFNRMTAERAKAEEQIRNFTATLEKRVELRTLELTRAKDELEAFSYSVSHDLQAPVRHVIAFSEMLLTDCGDEFPEEVRTSLLKINKAGITMRELIIHLLELSRLNRQELNMAETDLGAISRNICQELAADDPTRKVAVVIADGLVAKCDPNLVEIVLRNLIGNSWKFTRRKASPLIEIGTTIHKDVRCFFVRDNGDGFDMAYAERLFTPFQRFHSADEFEGSGVGLATVMRIVQRHEGAIWAESSPAQGSVFYFTLGPEE